MSPPIQYGKKMVLKGSPESEAVLVKLTEGSREIKEASTYAIFIISTQFVKSIRVENPAMFIAEDTGETWRLYHLLERFPMKADFSTCFEIAKS